MASVGHSSDTSDATLVLGRTVIVIDCPVPPSLNRLWRVGNKRIYKDPKHARWMREFWYRWLLAKPPNFSALQGQLDAEISICPKRKRDADNSAKALLDAAQQVGIITNDSQFRKVTQELVDKDRAPLGCRLRIIPL